MDRRYQSIGCLIFHHSHLVSASRRYQGAVINISDGFHVVLAGRRYRPNSERLVDWLTFLSTDCATLSADSNFSSLFSLRIFFQRIDPSYWQLASTPLFFPLRSQFPALQLLDCTCFPLARVHTKFGLQRRTQRSPSTSTTSLQLWTHCTKLPSSSTLCFQPHMHTHSPHSQSINTHLSRASVSSHRLQGIQPLSLALTELKPHPLALFPTFQDLSLHILTPQCALDLHSIDAATWRGTTKSAMFTRRRSATAARKLREKKARA